MPSLSRLPMLRTVVSAVTLQDATHIGDVARAKAAAALRNLDELQLDLEAPSRDGGARAN